MSMLTEEGRRDEDRNPWAKVARTAERYKILWLVALVVATWTGSRIIQPLNMITSVALAQSNLEVRVTLSEKVHVDLAATQKDMAAAIVVLTKIACAKNLTPAERYAFGVDCGTTTPRSVK